MDMILDSPRSTRPGVSSIVIGRIALVSVCLFIADSRSGANARGGEEPGEHWAYQPIRRPPLPRLERGGNPVENPIEIDSRLIAD